MKLSAAVWQLDWSRAFPVTAGGVEIAACEAADVAAFMREHYEEIFLGGEANARFLWQDASPAKSRYYALAGDFFAFRADGRLVGCGVLNLVDWSTCYVRSLGLLADFRSSGAAVAFIDRISEALAPLGVERLEADAAPNNGACIGLMQKLGFVTTGMKLSERWGSLVTMTRYLSARHAEAFAANLCFGGRAPGPRAGRAKR